MACYRGAEDVTGAGRYCGWVAVGVDVSAMLWIGSVGRKTVDESLGMEVGARCVRDV
jgi:hypothetical protein